MGEQSSLDESAVVTEDDLARFKAEWAVFDVDSDMTISLAQLPQLMDELPFPMGFKIIGLGQQYFCKKNCRSKKQDPDGSVRTSCTCAYADNWNLFDFIIVVGTMFGLVFKYSAGFSGIN